MLLFYTSRYHNPAVRFLHSFFIQMPLIVWFRFVSLLIPSNKRFVNYTAVSDQVLEDTWKKAQQELGTKEFTLSAYGPKPHPADPRALTLEPKNVAVIAVPDWALAELSKINPAWAKHHEPSGAFALLGNGPLGYMTVAGVTHEWTRPRIYGAASVIPPVLEWEFQNVILKKLGYDVEGR
jgi:hypothetical protein